MSGLQSTRLHPLRAGMLISSRFSPFPSMKQGRLSRKNVVSDPSFFDISKQSESDSPNDPVSLSALTKNIASALPPPIPAPKWICLSSKTVKSLFSYCPEVSTTSFAARHTKLSPGRQSIGSPVNTYRIDTFPYRSNIARPSGGIFSSGNIPSTTSSISQNG